MMKKSIVIICMFLCFLVGCDKEKTSIKVVVTYWNGWDSEYVSPMEEYEYEIEEGKSYEIPSNFGDPQLVITITKITSTGITITTNNALCLNESGTIDFNEVGNSFTITLEEGLKLVTATLDAGVFYDFSIKQE